MISVQISASCTCFHYLMINLSIGKDSFGSMLPRQERETITRVKNEQSPLDIDMNSHQTIGIKMIVKGGNKISKDFCSATDCNLVSLRSSDSYSEITTVCDIYYQRNVITNFAHLYVHLKHNVHIQIYNNNRNNTGILL